MTIKHIARITRPPKSAMQSARGNTKHWQLTLHSDSSKWVDPTMGWISGADTARQLVLNFDSEAQAVAYAKGKDLPYEVIDHPTDRSIKPKAYANNFAFAKRRYFDGVGNAGDVW